MKLLLVTVAVISAVAAGVPREGEHQKRFLKEELKEFENLIEGVTTTSAPKGFFQRIGDKVDKLISMFKMAEDVKDIAGKRDLPHQKRFLGELGKLFNGLTGEHTTASPDHHKGYFEKLGEKIERMIDLFKLAKGAMSLTDKRDVEVPQKRFLESLKKFENMIEGITTTSAPKGFFQRIGDKLDKLIGMFKMAEDLKDIAGKRDITDQHKRFLGELGKLFNGLGGTDTTASPTHHKGYFEKLGEKIERMVNLFNLAKGALDLSNKRDLSEHHQQESFLEEFEEIAEALRLAWEDLEWLLQQS